LSKLHFEGKFEFICKTKDIALKEPGGHTQNHKEVEESGHADFSLPVVLGLEPEFLA
jgi:hypothetical protein